ncbi:MAG: DUF3107 domain-containing protein [Actinomycetota bacterium]
MTRATTTEERVHVRIGVINAPRELSVEVADDTDLDALRGQVDDALGDDDNVLWLTDKKDQAYAIPVEKIGYVVIGSPQAEPRIGFGN